jgi:plastocyanin
MTELTEPFFDRRTFLLGSGSTILAFTGCIGQSEPSGPQNRSYTLTITRPGETLELQIEPAGEVADVIQIHVGDTVEFTITNAAAVPVGIHNHADDAEIVIEPDEQRVMTFEATEAMTGRQEIEGWVAEGEYGEDGAHDEHGGDATSLAIIEVRPRGS